MCAIGRMGGLALVILNSATLVAAEPFREPATYTYKEAEGLQIQADVYRSPGDSPRPVLVWIHGGALIVGSRKQVPQQLLELCQEQDYVFVSLDYRLAPVTKLPEIAADIEGAWTWLQREGPQRFGADVSRIVVAGGSAGGFLTLLLGARVQPRPTALVAYWGYGDLTAPWSTEHSLHHPAADPSATEADLRAGVSTEPTSGTVDAETQQARGQFYRWSRREGRWPREVTGFDPQTQAEQLLPYCPAHLIDADYPPTLLVHGTLDTDVVYQQAEQLAAALTEHGVAHELVSVPDAEHGLAGGDPQLVAAAHRRALDFIRQHLAE